MEFRKLVSFGKSSFVVSLPLNWLRQNQLKKGDFVYFEEKDGNLVLSAKEHRFEEKEKSLVINIDGKSPKEVDRALISAYINNNKTITLIGEEVKSRARDLQLTIQSLIALEIMEQDSRKIVARDFLNLNDVSTKTILRKVDVVIRSMFEDSLNLFEEDNSESIIVRDHDVNKLSFLMFRILRQGLHDPSYLTKKLQLKAAEVLNLWWLTFELESIGDDLKRIARSIKTIKLSPELQQEYKKMLVQIKKAYLEQMKAYYEPGNEFVHDIINDKERWLDYCDQLCRANRSQEGLMDLIYHTKAAIVHISHIGRLLHQTRSDEQN